MLESAVTVVLYLIGGADVMHRTQFIQFAQCFGNESIGLTVRSLHTLPYPAKLPQYYLSYIGLAKERPGDEPGCFYRMPDSSGPYMAAFA